MGKKDSDKRVEKSKEEKEKPLSPREQRREDILRQAASLEEQIEDLEHALPEAEEATNQTLIDLKADFEQKKLDWKGIGFNGALRRYRRKVGRLNAETIERKGKEAIARTTIGSLEELKDEIEKFMNRDTVALAAQRLVERGLTTYDLKGGENHTDAVNVFFKGRPDIASMILALDPSHPDTEGLLNFLASTAERAIETRESARAGMENVEEEVVLGAARKKLGNVVEKAAENPGKVMIGLVAGIGVLAILNHYKDSFGFLKKPIGFLTKAGIIGGAGAGLVLGANWLHRTISDDETGFLDDISSRYLALDKDAYDAEHVSYRYRDLLERLPNADAEAVNDLLKLGETDAIDVADAFDDALRDPAKARTIDTRHFRGDARKINGMRAFEALAEVMLLCANEDGVSPTESDEQRYAAGLDYFRRTYGEDYTLSTAIMHLIGSAELPRSLDEAASEGVMSFRQKLGRLPASPEERKRAGEIMKLFAGIEGAEAPVQARGVVGNTTILSVKGYLFEYTYEEGSDTHVFEDPRKKYKAIRIPVGGDQKLMDTRARMLISEVNKRMPEVFWEEMDPRGGLRGGHKLVFDKTSNEYWVLDPPYLTTTKEYRDHLGATRTAKQVPLKVYYDEKYLRSGPVVYVEGIKGPNGKLQRLDGIAEAVDKYDKQVALPNMIREDIGYTIGEMPFQVTEIKKKGFPDPSGSGKPVEGVDVKIRYGTNSDKIGYVRYYKGDVIMVNLQEAPELEHERRKIARRRAADFMDDEVRKSDGYMNARAAFEGHWKGKWWESAGTIPAGRAYAAVEAWLDDDHMGRGLLYNRERWWQEMRGDFKMREYEHVLEMAIYRTLEKYHFDPAAAESEIRAHEERIGGQARDEFQRLANEIEKKLAPTHGDADRGVVLEEQLMTSIEELDMLGYNNAAYRSFVKGLEEMMNDPGFDWGGADGWRHAREIREGVRLLAFEYAWPIPHDAATGPNQEMYLRELKAKIHQALKIAQEAAKGNTDWIVTTDRRITYASFKQAMQALGVKKFAEEYPGSIDSVYRSSTKLAPSAAAGALASGPMSNDEYREALPEAEEEIRNIFEEAGIDDMEWNVLFHNDDFDSFYEDYVSRRIHAFNMDVASVYATPAGITGTQFEAIRDTHYKAATLASQQFRRWKESPPNRENLLDQARGIMIADMAPGIGTWRGESKIVADLLNGEHDFNKFFVVEDAAVLMDMMNFWYTKVGTGALKTTKSNASESNYRDYFLFHLLNNVKRTHGSWKVDRKLSWSEWERVRSMMHVVDSYDDWSAPANSRIEVKRKPHGLDLPRLTGISEVKDRETVVDEFDARFESRIDTMAYWAGGLTSARWHDEWEESVRQRKSKIVAAAGNNPADLENRLYQYEAFLLAELMVYDKLIIRSIKPGDLEGGVDSLYRNVIDPSFALTGLDIPGVPYTSPTPAPGVLTTFQSNLNVRLRDVMDPSVVNDEIEAFLDRIDGRMTYVFGPEDLPLNAIDSLQWQGLFNKSLRSRLATVKSESTPSGSTTPDPSKLRQNLADFESFIEKEMQIWAGYVNEGYAPRLGRIRMHGIDSAHVLKGIEEAFQQEYVTPGLGHRNPDKYFEAAVNKVPKWEDGGVPFIPFV